MVEKHTPGPWKHEPVYRGGELVRNQIMDANNVEILFDVNRPEDAPLIAAAPELLEALVEAKREMWAAACGQWNLADFKNWAVIQRIDAALTKARGEQS